MTSLSRGNYLAEIIADSIGPHGVRITTMRTRYPRFIHAEMLRHRVFAHSVSSSRAIPPEKLIEQVRTDPFVPETFNARVKGMGVGDELGHESARDAREAWLEAAHQAAKYASLINEIGVDKSRVNRLLEPFLWVTDLITATDWSNFFALRQPDNDDPVPQLDHGAQPEFQIIARLMRDAMRQSIPREMGYGDWHLPYVADEEIAELKEDPLYWAKVSAGRCFVTSYDRLDQIMDEPVELSIARYERGASMAHWSPMEHPAAYWPEPQHGKYGPLRGWKSLRFFHRNEDDYQRVLDAAKTTS